MVADLVDRLREIVGRRHILIANTEIFTEGYRFGGGPVEAVVRPGNLVELWRVASAAVAADRIIIMQAANTGLTGGSTPDGRYGRPVILINTLRIGEIFPIKGGEQVVCLAGATLDKLEGILAPLGREPHSVIGSSCIGASVVGGICNNSGGSLLRRGPAYTEYALYARVAEDGTLQLCNNLGLALGNDPIEVLTRLQAGDLEDSLIDEIDRRASCAAEYSQLVTDVEAPSPARFNADTRCLFEASGSAGRLVVFAVRLDTFARETEAKLFYVGSNDVNELTEIRRRFLSEAPALPISGEYIHAEAFDLADQFGKDTVFAIAKLGTKRLPRLFRCKAWVERVATRLPLVKKGFAERTLQRMSLLLGDQLPTRMRAFRARFEHHLIVTVPQQTVPHATDLLAQLFPSANGDYFECTSVEAERAMLHRFAVAGAAVRYRAVRPEAVEEIVALDIALPRNARDWFEKLPKELERALIGKLYYGHFFCHVFHQDYLVRKGEDAAAVEQALLELCESRGAEYPAEHNVGHHYHAKPALVDHYRSLDPTNSCNPGIGRTSRERNWQ